MSRCPLKKRIISSGFIAISIAHPILIVVSHHRSMTTEPRKPHVVGDFTSGDDDEIDPCDYPTRRLIARSKRSYSLPSRSTPGACWKHAVYGLTSEEANTLPLRRGGSHSNEPRPDEPHVSHFGKREVNVFHLASGKGRRTDTTALKAASPQFTVVDVDALPHRAVERAIEEVRVFEIGLELATHANIYKRAACKRHLPAANWTKVDVIKDTPVKDRVQPHSTHHYASEINA